ncbi:hypothetical protein HYR54_07830 [Candidatus Acetothermia bacterium]|nr:hypothetical protein [Candidatus Acetothermia bacterium]MBI3460215.1 hypothetical protein [Candidatus Acetothermia bacterium]MBI3661374.1 hypothetical protein [Candidatus Acetothermia bacterium]
MPDTTDRRYEWFVPTIGPLRFRMIIGMLFLPYTGMVLAFTVIGATLADAVNIQRVGALALIYFLALGVAAHALDALGSRGRKPWGTHFSAAQLWTLVMVTLLPAGAIGIYYALHNISLLWLIGLLEFFFLFAYNLEWFNGRFHTDGWFFFSWGVLPMLAGYVMQTNRLSVASLLAALATGLFSLVQITASRPYKNLKRASNLDTAGQHTLLIYERILKSISLGIILLALGLLVWRLS